MAAVVIRLADIDGLKDDLASEYYRINAPLIKQAMQRECPVDTGVLRQQHQIGPLRKLAHGQYLIKFRAMPFWGAIVHEGHGVIVPVRAKVLRFVTKTGTVVFTKRVRAVAANPWMHRAMVLCGLPAVRVRR